MEQIPPEVAVVVTRHALLRYRQRFLAGATAGLVGSLARLAVPPRGRVVRWLRTMPQARPGNFYLADGRAVFVLIAGEECGRPAVLVLTALPLAWAEGEMRARKLDKGKAERGMPRGKKRLRAGRRAR